MAAPTLLQIMQGIEGRLATIDGLRASDTAPGQLNPPAAIVGIPSIANYHAAMRSGAMELFPTVTVLVSAAMDRVGQEALAAYAAPTGASSVKVAIEADRTLGGLECDCFVRSFRPLGIEEVGAIGYYGGVFDLYVIAAGA